MNLVRKKLVNLEGHNYSLRGQVKKEDISSIEGVGADCLNIMNLFYRK